MKKERAKERSQPEMLKDMVDGIIQATGAASQLIHSGGNPVFWLTVRESLELCKEGVMMLAPTGLRYAEKPKIVV